jgi:hypothetical protein
MSSYLYLAVVPLYKRVPAQQVGCVISKIQPPKIGRFKSGMCPDFFALPSDFKFKFSLLT